MHQLKKTTLFIFFLFLTAGLYAQSGIPEKVLFIGNSYTYFWNLPQAVSLMAAEREIPMITRQSTSGGTNLGQHWRGERDLNSLNLVRNGDFDAVIIQDHSMRSIEAPDSLLHYGTLFGDLIKEKDARPYVYMTWARKWDPYMQKTITETYTELAEKIGARIVPVGPAWERARSLRPDLELYDEDQSHPSTLGTYLAACVFFRVLTGQSPVGLPNRLITVDKDGEKLYITIQSQENALFCQKVAEEVVGEFGGE